MSTFRNNELFPLHLSSIFSCGHRDQVVGILSLIRRNDPSKVDFGLSNSPSQPVFAANSFHL